MGAFGRPLRAEGGCSMEMLGEGWCEAGGRAINTSQYSSYFFEMAIKNMRQGNASSPQVYYSIFVLNYKPHYAENF
jgi:hypothetical protein